MLILSEFYCLEHSFRSFVKIYTEICVVIIFNVMNKHILKMFLTNETNDAPFSSKSDRYIFA